MQQISARVPEATKTSVEAYSDENDLTQSEAIRDLLERGFEYKRLQRENERLQGNLQQLLEQREEHTELVRYAEDQRDENQSARERRKKPAWTRAWWWLTGEPE